jgi:hypothetical protein
VFLTLMWCRWYRIREDSPYLLLGDEEGGGGPGHAGELETELGVVRNPAYSSYSKPLLRQSWVSYGTLLHDPNETPCQDIPVPALTRIASRLEALSYF